MSDTSSVKENLNDKINGLYKNIGFMQKYGTDLWATVIICIIFILLSIYFMVSNSIQIVKSDWHNQKCNPAVIPFAGFINKPQNMSNVEFTGDNFGTCVNTTLENITSIILQPLFFMVDAITTIFKSIIESMQYVRILLSRIREAVESFMRIWYDSMSNVLTSFITFIVQIKDAMQKVNGILTGALYTFFGSFMALTSFFLIIIDLVILILIIIACIIIVYFIIMMLIFCVGCWAIIPNTIAIIIFIAILIPVIWFKIMMDRVLETSTPNAPNLPTCFIGSTLIDMFEKNKKKKISDIKVGDILKNESVVTSVLKLSAKEQNIYSLYNVYVTGEHRVFHTELKWIKVKDHPDSIYVPNFNQDFVYCFNTDKKLFTIGDTLYSDWDDIDDNVLDKLNINGVKYGHLPNDFKLNDIHKCLDSGLHKDTKLTLNSGKTTTIKDIEVNDILLSGDKIYGIVKIKANDLQIYNYTFGDNKTVAGSKNIHIIDADLGVFNLMNDNDRVKNIMNNSNEEYLYHLLTDSGFITVNDNIRINDYNYGIDYYTTKK